MSEQLPISVHILTWNSGHTLRHTIESVRRCAEILIIDGGSTDDTLRIAQVGGTRVIPQREASRQGMPIEDFSSVRNVGLRHATQPWILALDSDEVVSPELLQELATVIDMRIPCACWVPRRYLLPDNRIVTSATTYPNARLYFFHRSVMRQWEKPVHERPIFREGTSMQHLNGATITPLGTSEEYRRKNLRYLAIEQEKDRGKGWWHWILRRLFPTLLSRSIATGRLLWIWTLPHRHCVRLPLRHEFLRFWYAWRLIIDTCPLSREQAFPLPAGEG